MVKLKIDNESGTYFKNIIDEIIMFDITFVYCSFFLLEIYVRISI